MIQDYGWSDTLQQHFVDLALADLSPARVIVQQRGPYRVVADTGEFAASVSGRFAFDAAPGDFPVTGDWVAISMSADDAVARIHAVLPRQTAFVRKASHETRPQVVAANVDVALMVASLNADLNSRRLERYLSVARESGARPVLVLTKADLCDDAPAAVANIEAIASGVPVLAVSVVTGVGLEDLRKVIEPRQTAVLLGSSGAGKSSLVNALSGRDVMATRAIREDDARGRHTTTHRELIRLPDGRLLLDTPGMREIGLWESTEGLSGTFGDVEALAAECRFRDCGHDKEPGCAVQAAIGAGTLDAARWHSYAKLQRELSHLNRRDDAVARAAHRKTSISRHKAYRAFVRQRERED